MKAYLLHIFIAATLLCLIPELSAQDPQNSVVTRAVVEGSDTLPIFELPEVRVYERKDFDYLYLKRRYRRMIRNIKKAYPYARLAGKELKELDDHLARLDNEKEQKAYINQAEKEIMDQFEKEVKKLTVTQGIILVKLIDRETGRTSYQVIKELKGGFTAFFWQGIARIFGNNLKTEYDPDNQDKIMEDIVLGIEAGFI
ncbi:MAG: DUF4294 domain-containing protein [Bacteroidetes bacterium]|nr:MAG: DUF4294 domain-containing protein [Bacteroidota bacterium]